jgi:ATP-dependent RNA helicase RhlE
LVEVLRDPNITRALIFTRTKHGADKIVKALDKESYRSAAIHGNKSQANREKALAGFKDGKILALVATDIAARGIDVDGVSHVFNYDLPFVPESYVHRIGRTARAGAAGEAIAFCTPEDRGLLRDIEKTIRQQVPIKEHALGLKVDPLAPNFGWNPADAPKRKSGGGRHMPKAGGEQPKKPHHRGQPAKGMGPQHAKDGEPRPGVRADGRLQKREWNPVGMPTQAIDQSQFARKAEGDAQAPGVQVRVDRPRTERPSDIKSPPKFGDRKFAGGGKKGFGKPRSASSGKPGNWMKSVGDKAKA